MICREHTPLFDAVVQSYEGVRDSDHAVCSCWICSLLVAPACTFELRRAQMRPGEMRPVGLRFVGISNTPKSNAL